MQYSAVWCRIVDLQRLGADMVDTIDERRML